MPVQRFVRADRMIVIAGLPEAPTRPSNRFACWAVRDLKRFMTVSSDPARSSTSQWMWSGMTT
jgi:hypothetical protein